MAIKQVDLIAPTPAHTEGKIKKGGGELGQKLGLLAGALIGGAATVATGGAAAPVALAALSGAGTGAGVGGMIGEKIKPTKEMKGAIDRRAELLRAPQLIQSESTQKLRESIMALHTQPDSVKQEYAPTLVNAYLTSLQRDNTPKGVA